MLHEDLNNTVTTFLSSFRKGDVNVRMLHQFEMKMKEIGWRTRSLEESLISEADKKPEPSNVVQFAQRANQRPHKADTVLPRPNRAGMQPNGNPTVIR